MYVKQARGWRWIGITGLLGVWGGIWALHHSHTHTHTHTHTVHTHVPHTPVTPFEHYLTLSSPPFKIWGSCGKTPRTPPSPHIPNTHTHTCAHTHTHTHKHTEGQCSPLGALPRWKEEWWRGQKEMKQMRWPRSSSFLSDRSVLFTCWIQVILLGLTATFKANALIIHNATVSFVFWQFASKTLMSLFIFSGVKICVSCTFYFVFSVRASLSCCTCYRFATEYQMG